MKTTFQNLVSKMGQAKFSNTLRPFQAWRSGIVFFHILSNRFMSNCCSRKLKSFTFTYPDFSRSIQIFRWILYQIFLSKKWHQPACCYKPWTETIRMTTHSKGLFNIRDWKIKNLSHSEDGQPVLLKLHCAQGKLRRCGLHESFTSERWRCAYLQTLANFRKCQAEKMLSNNARTSSDQKLQRHISQPQQNFIRFWSIDTA